MKFRLLTRVLCRPRRGGETSSGAGALGRRLYRPCHLPSSSGAELRLRRGDATVFVGVTSSLSSASEGWEKKKTHWKKKRKNSWGVQGSPANCHVLGTHFSTTAH